MSLWGPVAGPVELCVQRESRPREAFAARYQPGQPLGELDAVAGRAGDFEMTEIPQWRCLQVRTWPENGEPDHDVVPTVAGSFRSQPLCARYADRRGVQREFEPAAHPAVP
jgi:hypothetical protein